ncbi:translation initiation factor IF-2 [Magnetovibrio sp. PR-2]|uniref:translation initiation factor IF-2 n=1 Tax=Magnetovibrio sp. PR-2 TaxID=3120356 RepID=UPI002FCDEBCC
MSDTNDTGKKPLTLKKPGKLELNKTVEAGTVKQSFSHGRSKMVQVERKKKRTFSQDATGKMARDSGAKAAAPAAAPIDVAPKPAAPAPAAPSSSPVEDKLTDGEHQKRVKALEDAKVREVEEKKRKVEEEKRAAEEAKRLEAEAAEAAKREAEDAAQTAKQETEAPKAGAKPEPKPQGKSEPKPPAKPKPQPKAKGPAEPPIKEDTKKGKKKDKKKGGGADTKHQPTRGRGDQRRRSGKLTISSALSGDDGERQRSLASVKRKREKEKQQQQQARAEGKKIVREVVVPETISVQELANRMAERGVDVIRELMKMGVMATINQIIDADTAELVVEEFGHKLKRVSESDVETGLSGDDDSDADLVKRPPVVTVMGHVDHGKTSLLDSLRTTDVAGGEAGGITQHIGAYQVTLAGGDKISFVDTPGHAAFTDMRARGAKVTDIVILVVAADDSVMPQTIEAIHHAKAAEVPIIVAVNKCDKPDADPMKVRTELLQHDIVVEEMGGDVLAVDVSAKARTGLEKLEEAILLQSEILDLKANPTRPAEGVIVEAKMEQGRGSVATALIQRGTLRKGDIFVAGSEWGRVRALVDDHGQQIEEAIPGMPVEILGLNGTPDAGDMVVVVEDDGRAREVTEYRQRKKREAQAAAAARGSLEQMFEKIKEGEAATLPVVVKADVHGSLEAITAALDKMGTDEVKAQVLHGAVGGINESDVILARASGGFIIGFNVRANAQARDLAKRDGVDIRYYSIIYDVTDDMRNALSGMLAPTLKEEFLGYAQVREVFSITKVGKVAGCMVTSGMVKRGSKVRLLRDDVVVHEGELSQLKRFKDDAKEVKEGMECGMSFANYDDIKEGDIIECFDVIEVARQLEE